jgi:hypothetical protein
MLRRTLTVVTLLVTTALVAQNRTRAVTNPDSRGGSFPIAGTTVSGFVTGVSGSIISLANGLVTLDISAAKVLGDDGVVASVTSITPGSLIFAVLKSGDSAPNAPLQVATIGVTRMAQVVLSGPVQSVDASGGTLTLLGRTIHVTTDTSFGGSRVARGLVDILPNQLVQVQANAVGGSLVATSVLVFAETPRPSFLVHGTVKSIGADSWVITDGNGKDIVVVLNAQTKIIGDPKLGDEVDVLINVDSASSNVAVSIMKSITTPLQIHLSGWVSSISATSWTISGPPGSMAPAFLIQVNAQTKISGDPRVGDRVDVIAKRSSTGFVALSITKI